MIRRRRLLALFVLFTALPLGAQELSIFDLNDFIDPREFGAVPSSRGAFRCPCVSALVSRVMIGWDHRFVNVMAPTALDVGFAHVATSYYRGPLQINLKASAVRQVHRPPVTSVTAFAMPREALALQIGYYRASGNSENARVGRMQATWRVSHYIHPELRESDDLVSPPLRQLVFTDVLHHEFGAEFDLSFLGKYVGSLSYTAIAGERPIVDSLTQQSRLAYVQRFPHLGGRWIRLEPLFSVGTLGSGLEFDDLHRLTVQPGVRVVVPLGWKGLNFNVRLAPTYQRHVVRSPRGRRYEWEETREAAIFIDLPIATKTFRPR